MELQDGPYTQRLFPGTAPGPHRACQHLGLKDKNWLCFQSPHCQSLTGSQQPGVTPQNRRLAPIIQFVIKSTDLWFSLKGWTLPRGIARILLPADPHFTPPCLEFQQKAEVKGREIRCWLSHLKNCSILSTLQRHGGSGAQHFSDGSHWAQMGNCCMRKHWFTGEGWTQQISQFWNALKMEQFVVYRIFSLNKKALWRHKHLPLQAWSRAAETMQKKAFEHKIWTMQRLQAALNIDILCKAT